MLALLPVLAAVVTGPVKAAEPAVSAPRFVQKVVRSADTRRDWELNLDWTDRKLSLHCVKAMTGRCAIRIVDAPKVDSAEVDLYVEWIGVPVGKTVQRTFKGQAFGLCLSVVVGDDKACEPLSSLTAF